MQSGAVKGSTQGASQDSSCGAFQGSAEGTSQDSNRELLWWEKQAGSSRCSGGRNRQGAQCQWILKTTECCHSVSPVGVSQADDPSETSESRLGSCSVFESLRNSEEEISSFLKCHATGRSRKEARDFDHRTEASVSQARHHSLALPSSLQAWLALPIPNQTGCHCHWRIWRDQATSNRRCVQTCVLSRRQHAVQ